MMQHFPRATISLSFNRHPGASVPVHRDRYGQHSHTLSNDGAEAATRALIRVVPLVYGALLGGLGENLVAGLAGGLLFSVALDFGMGKDSLLLNCLRPVQRCTCPLLAALCRTIGALRSMFGLGSAGWAEFSCEHKR